MARFGFENRLFRAAAAVLRDFVGGNRGGVLVWGGFILVPLIGFMGLGVDGARGYMVKGRLSQALDAAALAAGKWSANTAKAEEEATMTFKANFPNGYMDAAVSGPNINFNSLNDVVGVSATAVLPTYFVHLLGVPTFTVGANTEVMRKTVYMDVVMSLDVSGSMDDYISGVKKIDAARTAAHTLTDSLFGASETKEFLKMGLVTKIKDSGVIIYAIQFGYNDGPQEALMKSIATGPTSPYYQYAPDAPALQMVFKEIGNHLSKLRLSK